MEVTNDANTSEPVVQIQKQGEQERAEITLSEFLKILIEGLPMTDNVNDEMRLNNGDVYIPSSLIIAPPSIDKKGEDTKGEEESTNVSTTTA